LKRALERADLANFQALARVAGANLDRDKACRRAISKAARRSTRTQSLRDQAAAGMAKTEAQIAQKLIRAPSPDNWASPRSMSAVM